MKKNGESFNPFVVVTSYLMFVFVVLFLQSSGVTVSTEAKTVYEEVKKDKKYRYIIYHIKDEKVRSLRRVFSDSSL